MNSLKYFQEEANEYHIICAGSLFGIKLSYTSFPVGKVEFMQMHPMSFSEFLIADNNGNLVDYMNSINKIENIPDIFFNMLEEKLKAYFIIGGMPEVVYSWINEKDIEMVSVIQDNILKSYESDFSKQKMENIEKKNAGITLVALVVTVIILLILAGILIATLTGSGLFENARLAEQKSTAATTHKFSTFTKTPGLLFEKNFEYDSETGDLICKEEGWYIINTLISITNPGRYNTTIIYGIVNGTIVMKPSAYADAGAIVGRNSDSITIYFKKNDKITFEKLVSAGGTAGTNNITIDIIKL